ncbi:uncharacterized protein ACA1_273220 [Acanthamoeba castellanii str. Neff]|jgi:hypothetical protein|uniref:Uncharacterized protein n=1 Tax=Acanthamoeba castellanii (strain ATCC 30010 / Neff) TaxID=1257118 RepID=L8GI33_ACACF|nr:uncharacterized protein ACA1_273220 [Acanthamoeba castellanii str. Neff]ELR11851.1 hypothetical protein ACA1_273220 [Acanthamoeba castellanii str. Neff]
MGAAVLSSSSFLLSCLLVLVLGLACPSRANETRSWTGQFKTTAAEHLAVAISLKFNSTSPAYSVISTTTINHLRVNNSDPAQLRFDHSLTHPVGNNEEGFVGPTHTVLPAPANTSLPRTFVDYFGPCELVDMFGVPLDARAAFSANQVIEVNATVRVDLTDVVSVVAKEAVPVPSTRTQYFSIDLPNNVSEVVILINSSDHHTNRSVGSVFDLLTIGCGADAQMVNLDKANASSTLAVVPFEKGGRVFITLQMAGGVPLPKEPSFSFSFETKDKHDADDDSDFWKPWVIGVIVGSGVGIAVFVFVVIGVVVWMVRSRRDYQLVN